VILALLPLAAAVTIGTQIDFLMQRNARSSAEAFYAAEAGLAHAQAELGPSLSLAGLLHGPDGTPDNADDGGFPFRSAKPASFTHPSLGYDVAVLPGPEHTLRLRSRGHGPNGAASEIEALVRMSTAPLTPGALYAEGSNVDIDLGGEGFRVSGAAPQEGSGEAVAGIAVSSPSVAEALRSSLSSSAAVVGTGPSPSIVVTSPLDIPAYTDALEAHIDGVPISASDGGPLTLGTPTRPQLTIVGGDWTITGLTNGFGILLIRGHFEVRDRLEYRGLVIVKGNVDLANTGHLEIEGALWSHGGLASRVHLSGSGLVRWGPGVLRGVDVAIPGALLHLPIIAAWRETS
jgi:hypothetical protein